MGNKIIKMDNSSKASAWLIVYIYHSFNLISGFCRNFIKK